MRTTRTQMCSDEFKMHVFAVGRNEAFPTTRKRRLEGVSTAE